eukprot:5732860-Amphidinium_carterae.1
MCTKDSIRLCQVPGAITTAAAAAAAEEMPAFYVSPCTSSAKHICLSVKRPSGEGRSRRGA